jgi:hypothetical protein
MWYLMSHGNFVGYVKVFPKEMDARNWFRELSEKDASRNVWKYIAICRVRAFSVHAAAGNAWTNWISGNLRAIDTYLGESSAPTMADSSTISPRFAWLPVCTMDQGVMWLRPYWTNGLFCFGDKTAAFDAPVQCSEWRLEETHLVRTYEFSNLPPPETRAFLKTELWINISPAGGKWTTLSFWLRPYRQLMPDDQALPDHFVTPPFRMTLFSDVPGAGTEASPAFRGGWFELTAYSSGPENEILEFCVAPTYETLCLELLSSGDGLTFTLLKDTEPHAQLRLKLPKHPRYQFRELYRTLKRRAEASWREEYGFRW